MHTVHSLGLKTVEQVEICTGIFQGKLTKLVDYTNIHQNTY